MLLLFPLRSCFISSISGSVTFILYTLSPISEYFSKIFSKEMPSSQYQKNRSSKTAWCPFSLKASHTPLPVTNETSLSVLIPPAKTTIFTLTSAYTIISYFLVYKIVDMHGLHIHNKNINYSFLIAYRSCYHNYRIIL